MGKSESLSSSSLSGSPFLDLGGWILHCEQWGWEREPDIPRH